MRIWAGLWPRAAGVSRGAGVAGGPGGGWLVGMTIWAAWSPSVAVFMRTPRMAVAPGARVGGRPASIEKPLLAVRKAAGLRLRTALPVFLMMNSRRAMEPTGAGPR